MNEALTPPLSLEDESSELSESEIFYDPEALSSAEQMQHDADYLEVEVGLDEKTAKSVAAMLYDGEGEPAVVGASIFEAAGFGDEDWLDAVSSAFERSAERSEDRDAGGDNYWEDAANRSLLTAAMALDSAMRTAEIDEAIAEENISKELESGKSKTLDVELIESQTERKNEAAERSEKIVSAGKLLDFLVARQDGELAGPTPEKVEDREKLSGILDRLCTEEEAQELRVLFGVEDGDKDVGSRAKGLFRRNPKSREKRELKKAQKKDVKDNMPNRKALKGYSSGDKKRLKRSYKEQRAREFQESVVYSGIEQAEKDLIVLAGKNTEGVQEVLGVATALFMMRTAKAERLQENFSAQFRDETGGIVYPKHGRDADGREDGKGEFKKQQEHLGEFLKFSMVASLSDLDTDDLNKSRESIGAVGNYLLDTVVPLYRDIKRLVIAGEGCIQEGRAFDFEKETVSGYWNTSSAELIQRDVVLEETLRELMHDAQSVLLEGITELAIDEAKKTAEYAELRKPTYDLVRLQKEREQAVKTLEGKGPDATGVRTVIENYIAILDQRIVTTQEKVTENAIKINELIDSVSIPVEDDTIITNLSEFLFSSTDPGLANPSDSAYTTAKNMLVGQEANPTGGKIHVDSELGTLAGLVGDVIAEDSMDKLRGVSVQARRRIAERFVESAADMLLSEVPERQIQKMMEADANERKKKEMPQINEADTRKSIIAMLRADFRKKLLVDDPKKNSVESISSYSNIQAQIHGGIARFVAIKHNMPVSEMKEHLKNGDDRYGESVSEAVALLEESVANEN